MGLLAKYDTESAITTIKNILVDEFNDKLDEITADKAKDGDAIVLDPVIRRLGDTSNTGATSPEAAIQYLGYPEKVLAFDPYIIIEAPAVDSIDQIANVIDVINIWITMNDTHDKTAEIRMMRYLRGITELFEGDRDIGIASVSSVERQGYLATPAFLKTQTKRLSWGIGLRLTR